MEIANANVLSEFVSNTNQLSPTPIVNSNPYISSLDTVTQSYVPFKLELVLIPIELFSQTAALPVSTHCAGGIVTPVSYISLLILPTSYSILLTRSLMV